VRARSCLKKSKIQRDGAKGKWGGGGSGRKGKKTRTKGVGNLVNRVSLTMGEGGAADEKIRRWNAGPEGRPRAQR